ncbi:MAG: oligosaccharide flippase family protein, partial [Planctomycetales bacterium]
GLYGQAFNLAMKPVHLIAGAVSGVMLPALSRARNDDDAYRALLTDFTRLLGLLLFPVGVGLAIVAPEVMNALGGGRWSEAGGLLRVLAIVVPLQGFFNVMGSVYASIGRADRLFVAALVSAILLTLGYPIGMALGQTAGDPVLGVAVSYAVVMALIFIPYIHHCLRLVQVALVEFLRVAAPSFFASIAMGVVVVLGRFSLVHWTPFPLLAAQVFLGITAYGLFAQAEIRWAIAHWARPNRPEARDNSPSSS